MEVEKTNLLYSIILGKKEDFLKEINNLKNLTQIEIDNEQNSILHFICDNDKYELLKIFFEKLKKDLNVFKKKKETMNPQIKIFINKKNIRGYTGLTYAVHNGNMVK